MLVIPVSVFLVDWPGHTQQPRQDVYEDSPHPRSHDVSLWTPKVNIENHHRYTDAGNVMF